MNKLINGWTKEKLIEKIETDFKGKSVGEDGRTCLYRGKQGTKCAVGLFIPDELYSLKMEHRSVNSLLNEFDLLKTYMPLYNDSMDNLQFIHDNSSKGNCKQEMIDWVNNYVTN